MNDTPDRAARLAHEVFVLNARIEAVEAQRNRALTDSAIHAGELAVARQQLEQQAKQLSCVESRLAAYEQDAEDRVDEELAADAHDEPEED